MRIAVMGNSGAGKSTLAARLAREHTLAHLDLDTLAWLPGSPPRRARLDESVAKLTQFTLEHPRWVIEGCYADLLTAAAESCTSLVFLNLAVEACVANCRARPFEPHKYPSPAAQDANLAMLISWVRAYETREDEFSLAAHRRLFDAFGGRKYELTTLDAALQMTLSQGQH